MPPELVGIVSDADWILYRKIQRLVFDTVRKRGLVQKQQAEALRAFKHATHVKATRAAKERSIRLQTLRSLGEQIRQKAQQTS